MAPRPGLTVERIVDVAAELVDRNGYDQLGLGKVAAELGVRTPSLYNHIDGLDELRVLLTVRALGLLGAELRRAVPQAPAEGGAEADGAEGGVGGPVGHAPDTRAVLERFARGYRRFALEHPGLYATVVPSTERADERVRRAGAPVVDLVLATLAGSGLDDETAIHAARTLRSAVHGFVSLELAGGFGLPASVDASFAWLTDLLAEAIPAATRN